MAVTKPVCWLTSPVAYAWRESESSAAFLFLFLFELTQHFAAGKALKLAGTCLDIGQAETLTAVRRHQHVQLPNLASIGALALESLITFVYVYVFP